MAFRDLREGVEELFAEAAGLGTPEFHEGMQTRDVGEKRRAQLRAINARWRAKQTKATLKALRRAEYLRNADTYRRHRERKRAGRLLTEGKRP